MSTEKLLRIIKAIIESADDLKWGERREIKCPECGGRMIVSKSRHNGHVWGVCQDCDVKIMQ